MICVLFPHLLPKRIWDCSRHRVIRSETVEDFKRGNHISGNHIGGGGSTQLSAWGCRAPQRKTGPIGDWGTLQHPTRGHSLSSWRSLESSLGSRGRPLSFPKAWLGSSAYDWQHSTALHVLFWDNELRLLLLQTASHRVISPFGLSLSTTDFQGLASRTVISLSPE